MTTTNYVSRSQARSTECPYCGARPDAKCVRKNGGERESNHRERVERYRARIGH